MSTIELANAIDRLKDQDTLCFEWYSKKYIGTVWWDSQREDWVAHLHMGSGRRHHIADMDTETLKERIIEDGLDMPEGGAQLIKEDGQTAVDSY